MVDEPPKPEIVPVRRSPRVPVSQAPSVLRPPVGRPTQRTETSPRGPDGMPEYVAPPKLLWCLHCQSKFDPKLDKSHRRHPVRDHHPKGGRHEAVSSDDPSINAKEVKRYPVGIEGFDRVVGGGIVDGSAILLGGGPGCGKTTLLGEVTFLCCSKLHGTVLYVSAEENEGQVIMRLRGCGLTHRNLKVVHTESLEAIEQYIAQIKPHIVVFDSLSCISTLRAPNAKSGSVQAMNAVTERIRYIAKSTRLHPVCIAICHENKEGDIAGPKAVEHMFDTVLHFVRSGALRVLEVGKNRFGPAPEHATFEFKGNRLREVKDAATRILPTVTGGVGCTLHAGIGTTLAVEAFASLPRAEDAPPATVRAAGIADDKFKDIVDAVATHTSIVTTGRSIKAKIRVPNDAANVADKAVDAAFVVALASTVEQLSLPADLAVFGELSPSGRLEFDPNAEARINAAKTARARTVIGPLGAPSVEGINYIAVPDIRGLVSWVRANCEFVGVKPEAQPAASVKTESSECPFDLPSHELSDVRPGVVGET